VDGESFAAVTNVGVRPTIDDGEAVTVEGFLLDFQGSLYGKTVRLDFFHHLRPERKFDSLDALRAQVMADADRVRGYFS
jgi:riboflavin kinase/FMN adenylyltransferase